MAAKKTADFRETPLRQSATVPKTSNMRAGTFAKPAMLTLQRRLSAIPTFLNPQA